MNLSTKLRLGAIAVADQDGMNVPEAQQAMASASKAKTMEPAASHVVILNAAAEAK